MALPNQFALAQPVVAWPPATPDVPPAETYQFALSCAAMGFHQSALDALRDLTAQVPDQPAPWRSLADMLRLAGKDNQAAAAERAARHAAPGHTPWPTAEDRRPPAKIAQAERLLRAMMRKRPKHEAIALARDRLFERPTDVAAMRVLAEAELQLGDRVTAIRLLERALELAPGYVHARADLAELLLERRFDVRALQLTTQLVQHAPGDMLYRSMHADALSNVGRFEEALTLREALIAEDPRNPKAWLSYAKALHFAGQKPAAIAAFRTCLQRSPTAGEAYWGLADLKGDFITEADIARIRTYLAGTAIDESSRMHMLYTLGHYLEQAKDYAGSFAAYEAGARVFGALAASMDKGHDADASTERLRRLKQVFTAPNIRAPAAEPPIHTAAEPPIHAAAEPPIHTAAEPPIHAAAPPPIPAAAATPIFIVGMPRAGSTLVEQILSSHSQVEGTRELPVVMEITRELALSRVLVKPEAYPECVLDLAPEQLAALGQRYLRDAAAYRRTQRPCFIDKRPWNWCDAGFIKLILPQARIIDVRRAPMAACFGMFKQLLPFDASFTADLEDLGRYYCEYVDMMRHWNQVMPGQIHFLQYEALVEDTETEIRRLLDYCGLPFEESCLRYWETERAVATPSAEQVRRPIYRQALEQWRNFEPWLGPLSRALERYKEKDVLF